MGKNPEQYLNLRRINKFLFPLDSSAMPRHRNGANLAGGSSKKREEAKRKDKNWREFSRKRPWFGGWAKTHSFFFESIGDFYLLWKFCQKFKHERNNFTMEKTKYILGFIIKPGSILFKKLYTFSSLWTLIMNKINFEKKFIIAFLNVFKKNVQRAKFY